MPVFDDGDLAALSLLGIYTTYESPMLVPNSISIVKYYGEFQEIVSALRRMVGDEDPVYVRDIYSRARINGYIYYDPGRDIVGVYAPKLSYMVVRVPEEADRHLVLRDVVPSILYAVIKNSGASLIDIMRQKAMVVYDSGKLIKIPDTIAEPTSSGNVPIDMVVKALRSIGKVTKRVFAKAQNIDVVTSPVDIDNIAMDVTLKITHINFDIGEHRMFLLENPIVLSGHIRTKRGRVFADGDLRYHPNINYINGVICLGTLPPFDGTLKWIARLLNMLMIGRIDVCMDEYSLVFLKKFKDRLPEDIIRMYEKTCVVSL